LRGEGIYAQESALDTRERTIDAGRQDKKVSENEED
jgi:hypothetical protein